MPCRARCLGVGLTKRFQTIFVRIQTMLISLDVARKARAERSLIKRVEPVRSIAIESIIPAHRAVPLSRSGHIRGRHPVKPGHGSVVFESLLERDVISALAAFPELDKIQTQPLTVFYNCDGVSHRYTPDLLVTLYEVPFELECLGFGLETLIECKPSGLVPMLHQELDRNFRAMLQATSTPLILLTDDDLAAGALNSSAMEVNDVH